MNYWWVNHKQTFVSEIEGGYIWSPKTEKNGARSQFYINLTRVKPGDIIFSYAYAKIMAIGVAIGAHQEDPKPEEFGTIGSYWGDIGWLVPIEWRPLHRRISPKEFKAQIVPLLPAMYSPLNVNGNGNQKC